MFDEKKILGNRLPTTSTKIKDMSLSTVFGKNPISDLIKSATEKPSKAVAPINNRKNKTDNEKLDMYDNNFYFNKDEYQFFNRG